MDPAILVEVGKWMAGVGIGAWTAYKAARGGAHKGSKEGAPGLSESIQQVSNEVTPNGHENLRSIVERIETKTDQQTSFMLTMHRQAEKRDDRVEGLERRVVKLEDHLRRVAYLVETKLGEAKEVVIKKEDQKDES